MKRIVFGGLAGGAFGTGVAVAIVAAVPGIPVWGAFLIGYVFGTIGANVGIALWVYR